MHIINTVLLSFGMSGRVFHAPFIQLHEGFKLKGVLERTKQASLQFYPTIHIYRSLEEVLQDEAVELVVVNTPTNTHYEFTKRALLAGKHVVVEKAFTTTVEEAIELKELAALKNLTLSVYQNRRWDSDYSTVKKIVADGLLGEIVEAAFHFDRYNENLSPKQHKEIPGPGAGLLNDLGPHLIDQALHLFGMPQAVFADIRTIRFISQVDDYFSILLYYTDKRVIVKSSILVKEAIPAFVVHGTKGSFLKVRGDIQEAALVANQLPIGENWGEEPAAMRGLLNTTIDGKAIRENIPTLPGNYGAYYKLIYQAITNNTPPPVTPQDGINVMRIIEAARKSSGEGKRILIGSSYS
ncbi:MAG: oxidoreductase [Sphingobacteriia bacterium]|nr:MAG: oxidoreductase [Sphingobacteriia bacterium]TAG29321.1 MAG: oxidoreductase [Sphingobacteriia bacterium]